MKTLNYIGCKHTLFPEILKVCKTWIPSLNNSTFMDLFAGTGVVSYNIQDHVLKNDSNDLEYYSFIINKAILKCSYSDKLQQIINECNNLDPVEGLMYLNYSPNPSCERMFFTNENARKCDAIRQHIQLLADNNCITENEFDFLLASLLVSVDHVANTSCVYGAYLKNFKSGALKPLIVSPIHKKTNVNVEHNNVFNMDANDLTNLYYDVVYMDPPYNQRQYSANYCPLNYLAFYDESIELKGKTGLLKDYNKSEFSQKSNVLNAFTHLIQFNCKYLVLSYNNEGLLDFKTLKNMLLNVGDVRLFKIQYKKFKAQKSVDGDSVYEYLWLVDKTSKTGSFVDIV